ncbi:hypothetical protein PsorP6_010229 [Peronosclerospora sorghi]|uniref:Uncharacterized protein n=1 Tax=Peronosclerospora sorghi TaxID=230839 RepID=A0ACC0VUS4_9STRA|nr:hypothetical protein PsorP6_010229 [Peronosclerospora sorghi]
MRESGLVPDRSDWFFDMTPVDYPARAIVHFASSRPVEALGQTLLIQNPSLPPARSWQRRLLRNGSAVFPKSDKVFDSTLSSELLQTAGISFPSVNKELLVTYTAQW